jgi:hypothetical protein
LAFPCSCYASNCEMGEKPVMTVSARTRSGSAAGRTGRPMSFLFSRARSCVTQSCASPTRPTSRFSEPSSTIATSSMGAQFVSMLAPFLPGPSGRYLSLYVPRTYRQTGSPNSCSRPCTSGTHGTDGGIATRSDTRRPIPVLARWVLRGRRHFVLVTKRVVDRAALGANAAAVSRVQG